MGFNLILNTREISEGPFYLQVKESSNASSLTNMDFCFAFLHERQSGGGCLICQLSDNVGGQLCSVSPLFRFLMCVLFAGRKTVSNDSYYQGPS